MLKKYRYLVAAAHLIFSGTAVFATTFVVPKDEVMVTKAHAIVRGTVLSSYTRPGDFNIIETVTQISVDETLKGDIGESLEIVEPGGIYEKRATVVHSSPEFKAGESVLLFLTRNRGQWEVTDLALGAFHSRQLLSRRVLVRSEDIEGWNPDETEFRDKARDEDRFLDYVRHKVQGRKVVANYFVDKDVSAKGLKVGADSLHVAANAFAASTYTAYLSAPGGNPWPTSIGTRWRQTIGGGDPAGTQAMPTGVTYFKVSSQNLSGAGDGGVSLIQNGLAAWNNDCGSVTNLVYGGTTATASGNDELNVVEFNDPQSRIAGSFMGSGTVAQTFSNFDDIQLINGEYWWVFNSADVVFQDGVTNAYAGMATTMTHELGHSIGFRHSNATRTSGFDQTNTCNGVDEECATAPNSAIMYWQVTGAGSGFTLQPWDINAVRAVYPGSCAPAAVTGVEAHSTSGTTVQVTWTGSCVTSCNVYRSRFNDRFTYDLAGSGTSPFNDAGLTAGRAYLYKVRAFNGVESPDSNLDLANTVIPANTIVAGSVVQAADINDTRDIVDAVRTLAAIAPGAYTNGSGNPSRVAGGGTTLIHATDITEARANLNTAWNTIFGMLPIYTNTITQFSSVIQAIDFNDFRNITR
ncbi:MAG TPA: hypothetical protein VER58_03780 [Thermoanaerobaculia bacterium]|nr:hypothetical protein [Thermoanaerobaculia bacterium]